MKSIQAILEVIFAIPLGILAVPLLIGTFLIKAFVPRPGASATVITLDTDQRISRHAG
jgi:hypothetical protein